MGHADSYNINLVYSYESYQRRTVVVAIDLPQGDYSKSATISRFWVGIQVSLKWCAIDYYLILRHVQTSEIVQNLLTNLLQPRSFYARNCNYDRLESQPCSGLGFYGAQMIYYLIFRHIKLPKTAKNYYQIYNRRVEFTRVNLICAPLNPNPEHSFVENLIAGGREIIPRRDVGSLTPRRFPCRPAPGSQATKASTGSS